MSGDLLIDKVLCEVKAGAGRFQGRDFRQVLIYAALNFQSRKYEIDSVCLVNPRRGIYLHEDINDLCFELAGAPAREVFAEIIDFVSQPHWMDEAV